MRIILWHWACFLVGFLFSSDAKVLSNKVRVTSQSVNRKWWRSTRQFMKSRVGFFGVIWRLIQLKIGNFSKEFCDVKLDKHSGQFLRRFLCYLMKKRDGKMLRIQNREFRIEASQLVIFPSKLWVNSALGQLSVRSQYTCMSECNKCSIEKDNSVCWKPFIFFLKFEIILILLS